MKFNLLAFVLLLVAASCSAPKYTYNFSYYDYAAGKKKAVKSEMPKAEIDMSTLSAAATNAPTVFKEQATSSDVSEKFAAMNKEEQRAYKKEIKKNIKESIREIKKMDVKSVQSAKAMDNDLKMAAIFGAIGIILGALWGVSSIIGILGTVAIIIALVFLIKWLIRQ